jgi:hypothetical protein
MDSEKGERSRASTTAVVPSESVSVEPAASASEAEELSSASESEGRIPDGAEALNWFRQSNGIIHFDSDSLEGIPVAMCRTSPFMRSPADTGSLKCLTSVSADLCSLCMAKLSQELRDYVNKNYR